MYGLCLGMAQSNISLQHENCMSYLHIDW